MELFQCFVYTGDIFKRDIGVFFVDQLGLGLTKVHDPLGTSGHLRKQEPEDGQDDDERNDVEQQRGEERPLRNLVGVALLDVRVVDRLDDLIATRLYVEELNPFTVVAVVDFVVFSQHHVDALITVNDLDLLHGLAVEQFESLFGVDALVATTGQPQHSNRNDDNSQHDPNDGSARQLLHAERIGILVVGSFRVPTLQIVVLVGH